MMTRSTRIVLLTTTSVAVIGGVIALCLIHLNSDENSAERRPARPDINVAGGTVLTYQVDQSKRKFSDAEVEQLASVLMRRLDPAAEEGISIRPIADGTIEIAIPRARSGHAERVQQIKESLHGSGSLEFRILANRHDDREAIGAAREMLLRAAQEWHHFLRVDVAAKWPQINTATKEDERTLADVAVADLAGIRELFDERVKGSAMEFDDFMKKRFRPGLELHELVEAAKNGTPPPPPRGMEGMTFHVPLNDDEDDRVAYGWVEIGPSELKSLSLDSEKRGHGANPAWQAAALARRGAADGRGNLHVLFEDPVPTEDDGFLTAPPGQLGWTTVIFSRRTADRSRLKGTEVARQVEYFFLTRISRPGHEITGKHVVSARKQEVRAGELSLAIKLSPQGGDLMRELTRANLPPGDLNGRRLIAIAVDGRIISAPALNGVIEEYAMITGAFPESVLDHMVRSINAGTLPAKLHPEPLTQRDIDPARN